MSEQERFDCIIVGAGPSGVAAGLVLAKAGLKVVILERGSFPGSKNLFGGILFTTILNKLIPEFWKEAPVERNVIRRRFSYLNKDSEVGLDFSSDKFNQPPFNNTFIVSRPKFDRWFAKKAEEKGALIFPSIVVDDLIIKDNKVLGVKCRGQEKDKFDELSSDVVILAEGANAMLAEKCGLRKDRSLMTPKNRAVAVKEVLKLPQEVIDHRFNLSGDEGMAIEYFGDATSGMLGAGFIYTYKEAISIGLGCYISEFIDRDIAPYDQLDYFKNHPCIKNLIRGAEPVEYSAKMMVEDNFYNISELVMDGLILVGDCAGLSNSSFYHEVTNLSMASGMFAAETVIEAKYRGDFSKRALLLYQEKLRQSFVLKDMFHFRNFGKLIHSRRQLLDLYPKVFLELLIEYFTITGEPKAVIKKRLMKKFRQNIPITRFLFDLLKAKDNML